MKRIIWDAETNGLLQELERFHCLVLRDLDSDAVISCADQPNYPSIREGLEVLANAELIVGHNIINYDLPAIKYIYPEWKHSGEVLDTLVMARYLWAHIEETDFSRVRKGTLSSTMIGRHSLAAWGQRLGVRKGSFAGTTDWVQWSPEMQKYCEQDTFVTKELYRIIMKQDPAKLPMEIEHELAAYLSQQVRNGIPFDYGKAIALYAKLSARREDLAQELRDEFGSWYARDKEFTPKRDNKKQHYTAGCKMTKIKLVEFNPASRDHIAYQLQKYGWEPTEFTPTGKPKIDETTLRGMEFPAAAKLREFLMLEKRVGQIMEGKQGWIGCAINDGKEGGLITGLHHIHAGINANGAVTHRATHSNPNLAQTPSLGAEYGEECRKLFYVPEGWKMLGADASGLELRCLAHYMAKFDDGAYGQIILNEDVHSANRDAIGLAGTEGRGIAKTFIYAFLYGAGLVKIGSILHPVASEAKQRRVGGMLKKKFLKSFPALGELLKSVTFAVKRSGTLRMPDGRLAHVRHQHAALNTLLQGSGSIICKMWIVNFNRAMTARFGPQGWDGKWAALLWVHDEIQIAVRDEIADLAAEIAVACIRDVTSQFNWRLPLDGESTLGANWAETH